MPWSLPWITCFVTAIVSREESRKVQSSFGFSFGLRSSQLARLKIFAWIALLFFKTDHKNLATNARLKPRLPSFSFSFILAMVDPIRRTTRTNDDAKNTTIIVIPSSGRSHPKSRRWANNRTINVSMTISPLAVAQHQRWRQSCLLLYSFGKKLASRDRSKQSQRLSWHRNLEHMNLS